MEETDHHLLVGKDAQDFARKMGFKIEEGLIRTAHASCGSNGSAAPTPQHYLDPKKRGDVGYQRGAPDGRAKG